MNTWNWTAALAAAVGLSGVAGCDLGDDGESDGPPGGVVSITAYKNGDQTYANASAFFIARLDTSNGSQLSSYSDSFIPDLRRDQCELLEEEEIELPEAIGLDVGSEVLLADSSGDEIALEPGFAEGSYASTGEIDPEGGERYSVSIEGTSEIEGRTLSGSIHFPDQLLLDRFADGTISIDSDEGTDIEWEPVGADAVVLSFQGEKNGRCLTEDDGSFKIPGEFAEDLGEGGYFTITAVNESKTKLEGRTVRLVGATGQSGTFTVEAGAGGGDVTRCSIVWMSPGTTSGKIHVYLVDMSVGRWSTGSKTFDGEEIVGALLYDYGSGGSVADQAVASSGQFSLTVDGSAGGDGVSFEDPSSQSYSSESGKTVSGGTGSFDGVLTAPDDEEAEFGEGSISITYDGTTLSLGESGVYAQCYDENAFAP